ncbi:TldD/PmbA family protein [Dinoroseobacter sp. S375]|uniref:TldD/PmbA family protein n=1 Tax=Dinoroseobacter sp. S375 TaxID=3415136 RepID=UPI003C7DFB5B
MPQDLSHLTEALLLAAKSAGAEDADAVAVEGTALSIDVRAGKLEQAERSEGVDLGLRVLIGQKQAIVSASDVKPDTLRQMAERAVAMAAEAPDDPHIGLAHPDQLARGWDVAALELQDPTDEPAPDQLEEDARRAEAAARDVTGISQVQSASAGYGRRQMHLATSAGFSGGFARTDRGLSVVAITGTGTEMERDYAGESRIFQVDLPPPEEVGALAAERTLARAGARKPPTGAFPVLYDERISSGLIGHLVAAISGSAIARGSSWLLDALGEEVLPPALSLVEDPHRARVSGSRPFDGEGLPTRRRVIVENGVLQGWTLDLATGRKLGMPSTGSAARGTSGPPSPAMTNLTLTPGTQSAAELAREMGTGLWVTSMIGASINPTTGDYSRGASGYWVENGEIAYAVNECTIAGNLRDMLRTLVPGNDARGHLSRVVPSLLVEGLTVAGA